METRLRESKYHIVVIVIYFIICLLAYFFVPSTFSNYDFRKNDIILFFPIAAAAFASLFIANRFLSFGTIVISRKNLSQVLFIFFYSFVLFALPEEIIFRGIIQKNLQNAISNAGISIVLSSIIFGAAHLLNSALGFWPKEWNWKLGTLAFIAGLFLGFAYFMTDSLIVPTVLHALFIIFVKTFIRE